MTWTLELVAKVVSVLAAATAFGFELGAATYWSLGVPIATISWTRAALDLLIAAFLMFLLIYIPYILVGVPAWLACGASHWFGGRRRKLRWWRWLMRLAGRLHACVLCSRRAWGQMRRYLVAARTLRGFVLRIGFAGLTAGGLGIAVGRGASGARSDFLVVRSPELPGQFVVLGGGSKLYAAGFDPGSNALTNQIALFETGDRTLHFTWEALGPLDPYGAAVSPPVAKLFRVFVASSKRRERAR